MPVKINNTLMCEYCFAPLKRHETCACGMTKKLEDRHPSVLALGTELAKRYIVGHVLGKGGFGITYLCYDRLLRRRTAIKEYMPKGIAYRDSSSTKISVFNKDQLETFKRGAERVVEEAETIQLFNGNPNIVSVYEHFEENNTVYYVMEYLEGCDVREFMKENGHLSEPQTVFLASQVLRALTIIHSRRILHRDISPDNIFICPNGDLKLIDFGAAKQLIGSETQLLSMVLKQGFAPIEQYQTSGKQQGPWTDLYALGATMYYCISGKMPTDAMTRVTDDSVNYYAFSPAMRRILQKALALQASDRYQNAYEMLEDIEKLPMKPLDGVDDDINESEELIRYAQEASHTHQFNPILTMPTCTAQGFTTHVCRCGVKYIDLYTPAMGHLWSEWRETDANHVERICRRCGATEQKTGKISGNDGNTAASHQEYTDYEDFT